MSTYGQQTSHDKLTFNSVETWGNLRNREAYDSRGGVEIASQLCDGGCTSSTEQRIRGVAYGNMFRQAPNGERYSQAARGLAKRCARIGDRVKQFANGARMNVGLV